jgi:hypothetical protein
VSYLNKTSVPPVSLSDMTFCGFVPAAAPGTGLNSLLWDSTTSLDVNDTSQPGVNAASQVVSASSVSGASSSSAANRDVNILSATITTTGNPVEGLHCTEGRPSRFAT